MISGNGIPKPFSTYALPFPEAELVSPPRQQAAAHQYPAHLHTIPMHQHRFRPTDLDRQLTIPFAAELIICIVMPIGLAVTLAGAAYTTSCAREENQDLDRLTLNQAWFGGFFSCTVAYVMMSGVKMIFDLHRIAKKRAHGYY
jgi:hypothetical protein